MSDLEGEAGAFDAQILERIANNHIPDLRLVEDCDYFEANPWRRAAYVKLDYGQILDRIANAVDAVDWGQSKARILEVGCGPGFISLELARHGYDVTGIDISPQAIEVAERFAGTDPWLGARGKLTYINGDFLGEPGLQPESFDAAVFVGALHHFQDQDAVAERVKQLLTPDGLIIAHEPTRDRFNEGLGTFILLVKVLLEAGGNFYKKIDIPNDDAEIEAAASKIVQALVFETKEGEKTQSPNDNDAGYQEMKSMLAAHFDLIQETDTYAFFHELIGGLRFDDAKNEKVAKFLRDVDARLVRQGVLSATEVFFVGQNRQ